MAEERYSFRVYLNGKGEAGYAIDKPEAFLSQEAIQRRQRRNIPITAADFPISPDYLQQLTACGGEVMTQSKWFSTVVISATDSTIADRLKTLAIVDSVKWVWKGTRKVSNPNTDPSTERLSPSKAPLKSPYGYAETQIDMLKGIKLHTSGFRGEGMRVAVIDAGFLHVDRITAFESMKLIGTHNVVYPGQTVYDSDSHGTKVLSCLAANLPGWMVGTAPEAFYLLIKSEDSDSEYPIEEDYWTAAVEYADSVGVDVISSSLGYFKYDAPELSYQPTDLDGRTALISRAASVAGEKGILLFTSAGNEGDGSWEKITVPADAFNVLTVGSVTEKKKKSAFSSIGYTTDGRIKPDVVAMGTSSCLINPNGDIQFGNGTSFATPILAGLSVCLWQALPTLTNQEIIMLLQETATQAKKPDAELGYGIPNLQKAYKKGKRYARKK